MGKAEIAKRNIEVKKIQELVYVIFSIVAILTGVIYLVKWLFGITLLNDGWYYFLLAGNGLLFWISFFKKRFKAAFVTKCMVVLMIIYCCIAGRFHLKYTDYYYIYSPNEVNKLVLKTYIKGSIHHPDGYLEVYGTYATVFKKKLYPTIITPDTAPVMGPEPKLEKAMLVEGVIRKKYYDSFFFLFKWLDEETLEITYKYPDKIYDYQRYTKQAVIKIGGRCFS